MKEPLQGWGKPAESRITRYVLLAGGLALAALLPSFAIGFSLDDYIHYALIEDWYGMETPPVNLYSSFLELPNSPWWSSEETRVRFWRPLPSALLRLDHALFGKWTLPYHVHSLLWLAALVGLCGGLFARLPRPVGVPALFVFAVEEAHGLTSGLICNRHAVVTLVPALFGLLAHLRYREDGWRPGRPLAVLGFAVALLGSEAGLAAMAYVLAYEIFAEDSLRARLRSIAPFATLAMAYLLFYKALDLGPREVGFYLDPLRHPGEYLLGLATHLPALLAGALLAFPASLWMVPGLKVPLVTAGLLASILAAWAVWRIWPALASEERRGLRWWGAGALLSMPPLAAAMPSDRQLLVPAVGFAVVIGTFLGHAWRQRSTHRIRAGAGLALLGLLHFGVAPASLVSKQLGFVSLNRALLDRVDDLARVIDGASPENPHDVAVIATDFFTAAFPALIYDFYYTPRSWTWNMISLAPFEHRLTRTGPSTLEVEPVGGALMTTELERAFRPRDPLAPGDVLESRILRAEILAADERGPTKAAFHFDRDLDSPTFHFLVWTADGLRDLRLREGESTVVEQPADLLGLL